MHISNVCRIDAALVREIVESVTVKAGVTPIPVEILEARQIKITDVEKCGPIGAYLIEHRGSMIPALTREVASELVRDGVAEWLPQGLLVYTMEDYLADKDVIADPKESALARASEEELVAVAVIGDNRSALAVCRNIVSGCQDPEKLEDDAKGAMDASNVFLVENM